MAGLLLAASMDDVRPSCSRGLQQLDVKNGWGSALQAGAEIPHSDRYGFFLDVKKIFVKTKPAGVLPAGAQSAFLKTLRGFLDFRGFRLELVEQLHAALPVIQAPALVVWGRQDRFVPCVHAEVLRQKLLNVEVQVWDRCGHVPQIECSQRLNGTTLSFSASN